MKKISVAFFADVLVEDFDGACRTIFQLIKKIPKNGFEFLFVCGEGPINNFPFKLIQIPSIIIPLNKSYKMALPFLNWHNVSRQLDKFKPDVIHITSPSPLGIAAQKYAEKNQIKSLSIYHTHFISYVKYYLKNIPALIPAVQKAMIQNLKQFYAKCSLVYIPSTEIWTELNGLGFKDTNMKLWQRGIDLSCFNPTKRDLPYVRSMLKNDYPIIFFASRLVWEKNLETLIQLNKLINTNQLNYNVVIAGDGTASSSLKEQMPDAFFLGKLSHEELAKWYASADIFLFPSISETFGNVVLEAMASGLPVVIGNGGGTISFVKHGFTGFVCKPNEASDYLEKIQILLENRPLSHQFRQRALHMCKQKDWQHLTDEYFNDLSKLVSTEKKQSA